MLHLTFSYLYFNCIKTSFSHVPLIIYRFLLCATVLSIQVLDYIYIYDSASFPLLLSMLICMFFHKEFLNDYKFFPFY